MGHLPFRELKSFDVSDPNIALDELATHLKRKFTDIHTITPRRFEGLVAEIFRSLGWQTRLTKQSADGGVDIYLLSMLQVGKRLWSANAIKALLGSASWTGFLVYNSSWV